MEAVGHTYVGVNIQRQSDIHIVGTEGNSPGVTYIRRDSNKVENKNEGDRHDGTDTHWVIQMVRINTRREIQTQKLMNDRHEQLPACIEVLQKIMNS